MLHQCRIYQLLSEARKITLVTIDTLTFYKKHFSFYFSAAFDRSLNNGKVIGKQMEYFLATGNLISKTGLGLMQVILNLIYWTAWISIRMFRITPGRPGKNIQARSVVTCVGSLFSRCRLTKVLRAKLTFSILFLYSSTTFSCRKLERKIWDL